MNDAAQVGILNPEWIKENGDARTHHFSSHDGIRCKHCGGYPFDILHWSLG